MLDEAWTDADGRFCVNLVLTEAPWSFRLRPSAEGRDGGGTVYVAPGDRPVLELPDQGGLEYTVINGLGDPSPARIALIRESDGAQLVQDRLIRSVSTRPCT